MRDFVHFYINGSAHRVSGGDVFQTLSDYLRGSLGAVGTKIVCAEGDCGACSVLVGSVVGEVLCYQPINACIQQIHQLDHRHIVTVEGLSGGGRKLNAIQESMMRCHGAQCGFCTPGFVVAMTAMAEHGQPLSEPVVREGLTGNLCRCTGYEPIIKAALEVDPNEMEPMNKIYPPETMVASFAQTPGPIEVKADGRIFFQPVELAEATAFKAKYPQAFIVQGGTDIGVQINKRGLLPEVILNVSRLPGFSELEERDGVAVIGGAVRWSQLEAFFEARVPEFYQILQWFGAPQIRHAGTMAGNIINASPIADSLPFLYVMEAELELISQSGSRRVPINRFYQGYKQLDLREDEFLAAIHLPLPRPEEILRLYKVSKRRDLDISTFTAAVWMRLEQGSIAAARLAYGGVGPTVLRLPETESFLLGRDWSEEVFAEAGQLARQEITPIDDVRGSAAYRFQLAENILLKFYHQTVGEEVA